MDSRMGPRPWIYNGMWICGGGARPTRFRIFRPPKINLHIGFPSIPHIGISEHDISHWATIDRVDIALLGDSVACRWAVLTHGDLTIRGLES